MGQLEHVRRERDEALADVRRLSGEAERLARERNQRAAEVGTGSEPSAANEAVQAEADVRPLRGRLEQTATSSTHPRGAVGELESPPSPRPPAAPDHIDATHRLLARAAAVSGIVIAILIVVALVVLR
jgi:hypothetical protein